MNRFWNLQSPQYRCRLFQATKPSDSHECKGFVQCWWCQSGGTMLCGSQGPLALNEGKISHGTFSPGFPSHPFLLHFHPVASVCGLEHGTGISLVWEGSVCAGQQDLRRCRTTVKTFGAVLALSQLTSKRNSCFARTNSSLIKTECKQRDVLLEIPPVLWSFYHCAKFKSEIQFPYNC